MVDIQLLCPIRKKNENRAKKEKQPHKLHIWFFADTKANTKKPKEQFLAITQLNLEETRAIKCL